MGSKCCKAGFDPARIHIKKLNEIFLNYLKNQGIDPSTGKGQDVLTPQITENVEKYAKGATKDLIAIIQINKKFIPKLCAQLSKRTTQPSYSAELKYLALVLLKELIQTPLKSRIKKKGLQPQLVQNEYIFAISNQKLIYVALVGLSKQQQGQNYEYFISKSLKIMNIMLNTLQRSQLIEAEDQYLEFLKPFLNVNESSRVYSTLIQVEAYRGFFKIVKQMRESNFTSKFDFIFQQIWSLVIKVSSEIQGSKPLDKPHDNVLYFEEIQLDELAPSQQVNAPPIAVVNKDSICQLHQLAFNMLGYLSMRLSQGAEQEEQFQRFLLHIFEYFDKTEEWASTQTAKFVFVVVICNGGGITGDAEREALTLMQIIQDSKLNFEDELYYKLTDYETLEQILDLFMKSFVKDMNLNNKSISEKKLAVSSDQQSKKMCQVKTNLLDVYAEVLKLSTLDKNIRHFEEYQYHQVMVQSLNSLVSLCTLSEELWEQLEKHFRMWAEIYFSKVAPVEKLIHQLDNFIIALQEETLAAQEPHIPQLKLTKISVIVGLIEATLYFIVKALEQEEDDFEYQHWQQKPQSRKLKESHQIFIITLGKRALQQGAIKLVENILNVDISMKLINNELVSSQVVKSKMQSEDFVMRYLQSLSDLISQYAVSPNELKVDYTCQIFEIWKLLVKSLETPRNNETLSSLFAFLLYIQNTIVSKAQKGSKKDARMRLLLLFMLNITAVCYKIQQLTDVLQQLQQKAKLDNEAWKSLMHLNNQEMSARLEEIVLSNEFSFQYMDKCLNLQFESLKPSLETAFEQHLVDNQQDPSLMKQRLESLRVYDPTTQAVAFNNESTMKINNLDLNQKFLMQSKEISDSNNEEEASEMNGGSSQNKGRIEKPEHKCLESLSSEMLKSADHDTVNGLSRQNSLSKQDIQDYGIDLNL